ncbi:hypothetical protein N8I71_20450 [Roseibacterium sp. SDUM158016]|uniref:hypothetical protein n=1 Tax=Roseicyclus sediminis TaxID=2980997 RepID=UPI0021CE54A6|nr:hypothetical protein [Roseibacterium sp. SDUM158016]MCU4655220.1 hypothetical protein [Roseibacterium sp. SDUM158016]
MLALLLAMLVALSGVIAQVSSALAEATARDVTYRYFDEALPRLATGPSAVTWQSAPAPLDRPFGPAEEAIVGTALTHAWAAHAAAMETGTAMGLADHFGSIALERASRAATVSGARMVVLQQVARPVFFHADGSLLQIEAEALIARFHIDETGALTAHTVTRDTTLTTLANEATGWVLISHERLASEGLAVTYARLASGPLAGINYYPAETPWTKFWQGFDAATIAEDFDRIAGLGGNAVRVFLQRDTFLDDRTAPQALDDLAELLSLAERAGLSVVPTLFDLRGGYEGATWANDAAWLARVLPVLEASVAVAYVDLKNEPDLDMDLQGPGQVEAWARAMLATARSIAPDLAYTIGWAHPDAAPLLADTLDLITYHDYGPVAESAAALDHVRAVAGDRPVHVTEIGETAFSLVVGRFPASPRAQSERLAARMMALAGADGIFVWTLHDFPEPDPAAIGRSPWVIGLQGHYGLIDATGTERPAAEVTRRTFANLLNRISPGDAQ